MKIFPQKSLLTDEFSSIRELIAAECASASGKELALQLAPLTDTELIRRGAGQCYEMMQVVEEGLPFPATGFPDCHDIIKILKIENSIVHETQLMMLLKMIGRSQEIIRFLINHKERFKNLGTITRGIKFNKVPTDFINEVLDENCSVRSSASPDLARIRRTLQRTRLDADKAYQTAIGRLKKQGWTAESEESSRNGRRVISVVAEQKRTVKGIIHDVSATGKTVFIEPEETIRLNNLVLELEQQERLEINRILRELTGKLAPFAEYFIELQGVLAQMDLIMGKAQFARKTGAVIPAIRPEPFLELRSAKHPLLVLQNKKVKKETIPFDLKLDVENRILIISGPNAGGKTVCMKTIGLLQMMIQACIPVTADADSTFGTFDTFLVDIGDSQSLEYELSTYSSRLKHMKIFLENICDSSLFLIDEFGTGTDPSLGGALAESVLEELNKSKPFGVITTHYLNLKVFADKTEGVFNGSMEFDLKRLKPMFKLVTGKPGSSYTFLVAERSGLPRHVIKSARKKVPRKTLILERLLGEVEKEKLLLAQSKAEAREKDQQLKVLIKKYEQLSTKNAKTSKEHTDKLKKLQATVKKESEDRFKNFLKEWKKSKDKKEVIEKYYRQFVQKKEKTNSKAKQKKLAAKRKLLSETLKVGMEVRLENGHSKGIVEKITDDTVHVQFGDFRTKCDIVQLEVVEKG